MLNRFLVIWLVLLLASCASPRDNKQSVANDHSARAVERSADRTYGLTKENPVRVGGSDFRDGPKRERPFLDSLRGPSGQRLSYQRLGSCCHFQTPHGINGTGLLDAYSVTFEGLSEPITIYINFYDPGPPLVPVGFTTAQSAAP